LTEKPGATSNSESINSQANTVTALLVKIKTEHSPVNENVPPA
jgi:hypothetical protein